MFPSMRLSHRAALTACFLLLLQLPAPSAADSNYVPRGHYLSMDRSRDLQAEMLDLIENPLKARSNYHLGIARDLHNAMHAPGVEGMWMRFNWRDVEVADGQYDWAMMDANIAVLEQFDLSFVINITDRSFNGERVMPAYFPAEYVLQTAGNGKSGYTSKRWDPYVYERLIRLYKAIAARYADNPAFGGIASTETATGSFDGGDYSVAAYRAALTEIVTRTLPALKRGKLFLYVNFIPGGDKSDMNKDARVALLEGLPHENLVVGAPDITPDVRGMPRSATAYRLHVRRTMPQLEQFCHLQHVDHGLNGINVKNNEHRQAYFDEVAAVRDREQQSWFKGEPAVFEFDDLRDPAGKRVDLHPAAELGKLWTPRELFEFGRRNFDCGYFFWHYREHPGANEFGWPDVAPVIEATQCFDQPGGCGGALSQLPKPPTLR